MTIKTHILRTAVFCIILLASASCALIYGQGIGFHGMDYKIDRRTSYSVFGDKPQVFHNDFTMDFELQTRPPAEFGYFFRVKDNGRSRRIWNLSYDSMGDSVTVRFNEEGRRSLIKATIPHESMKHLHWLPVKVDFDLAADSVSLFLADSCYRAACEDMPDRIKTSIEFGRSDHIIDVPSFAIRNLTVSDSRKKYHFPLDQSEGGEVWDDSFRIRGEATNPEWLINEATRWKNISNFNFTDIAGASYNEARKEFYYFTRKQITLFSLMTGQSRTETFRRECPVEMKLGNNFISPDGRFLYCYELYNDEKTEKSASVAILDLDSLEWKSLSDQELGMPLHHHCSFFNPHSGRYTILGGFGNMMYNGCFYEFCNNNLSNSHNSRTDATTAEMYSANMQATGATNNNSRYWSSNIQKNKVWRKIEQPLDGDIIYPRYFTSAGTDGDYIYVYGGMGNECGEQVVGRRYFYDLHRVNPETFRSELVWNCEWDGTDKVPVRNLYIDGDSFYTLCYPEYIGESELYLYRFSLKDGSHEALCNSIPINSDKMRTNANLYLDRELGQFFTTVQVFEDDIKSTLTLWSLSYPPLDGSAISAMKRGKVRHDRAIWLSIVLCLLLSVALAVTIVTALQRRSRRLYDLNASHGRGSSRRFSNENMPDTIYLFGDFTVIGHDGSDITQSFTKQQIMMLVLLIKRGENGMSGKRLSSILWPDKEEDKVKNSRGVAINNLRKSLSKLDGATVSYRNGRYYIELGDRCSCDWFDLLNAMKESGTSTGGMTAKGNGTFNVSSSDKGIDKDEVLRIVSRGRFLKSVDEDIFDDFKEKTDNMLLPLLHEALDNSFRKKEYSAVGEIGKMIMRIDPTDEATMQTIIRSLKKQKMLEEALVYYSEFCSEYKKANGTDFPHSFRDI